MAQFANPYAPASTGPAQRGAQSEPSGMSPGMFAEHAGNCGSRGEPTSQQRGAGTMRAGTSAWGDNESTRRGSPMPRNARIINQGNSRRGR